MVFAPPGVSVILFVTMLPVSLISPPVSETDVNSEAKTVPMLPTCTVPVPAVIVRFRKLPLTASTLARVTSPFVELIVRSVPVESWIVPVVKLIERLFDEKVVSEPAFILKLLAAV